MKLNNLQKDFCIFFSIIISVLIVTLLWEKVTLPLNNTIGAKGALVANGFNPNNDTARYILFISLPMLVFLFLNLVLKEKFINIKKLIFEKEEKVKNNHPILLMVSIIFIFFIFLEFFSLNFPVAKLDLFHDGDLLTPAQNYISTNNLWTSTYMIHGGSDIFYPVLMWKILGVETVGAARTFSYFLTLVVKLLTILLAYQLTKISNSNKETKILFFTVTAAILVSMSQYRLITYSYYFSFRDLFIILFLIFFIELFIYSKFRYFFIILISLITTISILFHIDSGIYLNFILIFYCLYLFFAKKYHDLLLIIFSSLASWFIVIQIIGLDEFKAFIDHTISIALSMDLMHALKYPEPFFSIGNDPNGAGARATRGLLLQLTAGLLVLDYLISNKNKILSSKKILFAFLFLLSFIAYKNALGRSDGGHIIMSTDLPILINCFFILNYLFSFLEKKNLAKSFFYRKNIFYVSLIFLLFFYISNHALYKIGNIKNFSQNFKNYIYLTNNDFLDQKTINLLKYYEQLTKEESCIQVFTFDLAIPYLLKKPSCTKYFSSWLASPTKKQKDYIEQIKKVKPKYFLMLYEPSWLDGIAVYERLELVHAYILSNYKKYDEFDSYTILIKK